MNRKALIVIPFAGGNRYSLYHTFKLLEKEYDVIHIELPGRGKRFKEPLLRDIHMMASDIFNQIEKVIDTYPTYSIYGHSLGGLLTYLVSHLIIKNEKRQPTHLYISGKNAPSISLSGKVKIHLLPRDKFMQRLFELGGMPSAILVNTNLIEFYEPILRADLQANENYSYSINKRLNIPMTILYGNKENISASSVSLWVKEGSNSVDIIRLTGNHFFIFKHKNNIVKIIRKTFK